MAAIKGTAKKDKLIGTAAGDLIQGLAGNDTLLGASGNDVLKGGTGNDSLNGDSGNDKLYGDAGKDVVNGAKGNDRLNGGLGADKLIAGDGADILDGGSGDDIMNGGSGNDKLLGSDGADAYTGGTGVDTVDYSGTASGVLADLSGAVASAGAATGDTFTAGDIENAVGTSSGDFLFGNATGNQLLGMGGADSLDGRAGADVLMGGAGDDVISPGDDTDADVIDGGEGDDTVTYLESSDGVVVDLEAGISAGAAAGDIYLSIENVTGSPFDDSLTVAKGGTVFGGSGADLLSGSTEVGTLTTETLIGSAGADSFLVHYNTGMDIIEDFTPGSFLVAGDKLTFIASEFAGIQHLADGTGSSTAMANIAAGDALAATRASAQFVFDRVTSILYFDEDGTGTAFSLIPVAFLDGHHAPLTNGGPIGSSNEFEIV